MPRVCRQEVVNGYVGGMQRYPHPHIHQFTRASPCFLAWSRNNVSRSRECGWARGSRLCTSVICRPTTSIHPSTWNPGIASRTPFISDAIPECIGVDINLDGRSCHAFGFFGAQQNRHCIRRCCGSIRCRSRCPTHSASATIVMILAQEMP
jgi:hypothetical protein